MLAISTLRAIFDYFATLKPPFTASISKNTDMAFGGLDSLEFTVPICCMKPQVPTRGFIY
jgi:hypothetical protein